MNRRRFICAAGVTLSLAGCLGSDDSVQDSDGDGVIDNQDYAPNDPLVQDKSDLQTTREFNFEADTTQDPTTTESEIEIQDAEDVDWDDSETTTSESLPEPVIQRLVSSNPKLVSVDQTAQSGADTFTATVQNEGDNGHVHVSLYWAKDLEDNQPLSPVKEKSVFFDSGERRTVSLHTDPPADAEEYEMRARTATRGAEITNQGASGDVKIELKGGELDGSEVLLSSQTLFIGENSTETVKFDGEYPLFGDDWKIEVSPADE